MNPPGLKNVVIRIQANAGQAEIDQVNKALRDKLDLSPLGLALDCRECTFNEGALKMLNAITALAKKDGKRLTLVSLNADTKEAIKRAGTQLQLDVFGEVTPVARPRSRKDDIKWLARLMVPVALVLPFVLSLEYWLMNWSSGKGHVVKSFEKTEEERFVIFGTVDAILGGRRQPDKGAFVIAWTDDADDGTPQTHTAFVTRADSNGQFRLPIPAEPSRTLLSVHVTVMSETLDAPPRNANQQAPSPKRPNEYHPTRYTQTYDYVVTENKPIRCNLLFF